MLPKIWDSGWWSPGVLLSFWAAFLQRQHRIYFKQKWFQASGQVQLEKVIIEAPVFASHTDPRTQTVFRQEHSFNWKSKPALILHGSVIYTVFILVFQLEWKWWQAATVSFPR